MSQPDPGVSTTRIIDIAVVVLTLTVFGMAIAGTHTLAVGTGVFILPGIGCIALVFAIIAAIQRKDFSLVDLGMFAFVLGVMLLHVLSPKYDPTKCEKTPPLELIGIGVGIFTPWGLGLLAMGMAVAAGLLRAMRADRTVKDFSSFDPLQERSFVEQETAMRKKSASAALIGFGSAAVMFVIGTVVVVTQYTPCSRFCERPPGGCKTEEQAKQFMAQCERACINLEKQGGLIIEEKEEQEKCSEAASKVIKKNVSGSEYVEVLTSCSFANSSSGRCEEVTKRATGLGLWCESKN